MSGQPFRNSSAKDQSRDFAFELTMASRFVKGGYQIQLNQLADIIAIKDDSPKIYIECKRINSISKLKNNIKKANEQLKKRLSNEKSSKPRGLVAINVNDIMIPDNNMLVVDIVPRLQELNSEHLNQFISSHENEFNSKSFNKCLGVFCEYISQAFIYDRDSIATCNCRGVKLYQYLSSQKDEKIISQLALRLSNQHIF